MSDTSQLPPNPKTLKPEHLRTAYQEVCTNYRAIDDFRAKLLGLLPLVSGTGIFFLLNTNTTFKYLGPIGLFGFVVTLGLFLYELSGLLKCHRLIVLGKEIEGQLEEIKGWFTDLSESMTRSWHQKLLTEKTLATCVIYSAVLAAWIFVALVPTQGPWWVAALVFVIFSAGPYILIQVLERPNTSRKSNKKVNNTGPNV